MFGVDGCRVVRVSPGAVWVAAATVVGSGLLVGCSGTEPEMKPTESASPLTGSPTPSPPSVLEPGVGKRLLAEVAALRAGAEPTDRSRLIQEGSAALWHGTTGKPQNHTTDVKATLPAAKYAISVVCAGAGTMHAVARFDRQEVTTKALECVRDDASLTRTIITTRNARRLMVTLIPDSGLVAAGFRVDRVGRVLGELPDPKAKPQPKRTPKKSSSNTSKTAKPSSTSPAPSGRPSTTGRPTRTVTRTRTRYPSRLPTQYPTRTVRPPTQPPRTRVTVTVTRTRR